MKPPETASSSSGLNSRRTFRFACRFSLHGERGYGDAAQRTLGGVVAQADVAVGEEAGEGFNRLEDVVHCLGFRCRGLG
jgi:hypothetical protein